MTTNARYKQKLSSKKYIRDDDGEAESRKKIIITYLRHYIFPYGLARTPPYRITMIKKKQINDIMTRRNGEVLELMKAFHDLFQYKVFTTSGYKVL